MGQSKVRKSCPGISGTLRASSITVPHFGQSGRIVSGCKRDMGDTPAVRREHYRTLSHRRLRDGPSADDGAQCALIEQIANHLNPGFLGLNLLLLLSYVIHEPIATSWLNYLHISSMWTVACFIAFWREYQTRRSIAAELS
jgi:hypothetical protein